MAYFTITQKKQKRGAAYANLAQEADRTDAYMARKERDNIDISRTQNNIDLTKFTYKTDEEFIDYTRQKIDEYNTINKLERNAKHRQLKKDSAHLYTYTIQATNEALSKEEHIRFLKEADNFLRKRFKDNTVLRSVIHLDETTPHLHFWNSTFNEKDCQFTQKKLQQELDIRNILNDFEKEVGHKYGLRKGRSIEQKWEELDEDLKEFIDNKVKNIKSDIAKQNEKRKLILKFAGGGQKYLSPKEVEKAKQELIKEQKKDIESALKFKRNIAKDVNNIIDNNKNVLGVIKEDEVKTKITQYVYQLSGVYYHNKELEELKTNNIDLTNKGYEYKQKMVLKVDELNEIIEQQNNTLTKYQILNKEQVEEIIRLKNNDNIAKYEKLSKEKNILVDELKTERQLNKELNLHINELGNKYKFLNKEHLEEVKKHMEAQSKLKELQEKNEELNKQLKELKEVLEATRTQGQKLWDEYQVGYKEYQEMEANWNNIEKVETQLKTLQEQEQEQERQQELKRQEQEKQQEEYIEESYVDDKGFWQTRKVRK